MRAVGITKKGRKGDFAFAQSIIVILLKGKLKMRIPGRERILVSQVEVQYVS